MTPTTAATIYPTQLSARNVERVFFATIPSYSELTDEQRDVVDEGGPYPLLVGEHLPEHAAMLDFLIERALAAWQR